MAFHMLGRVPPFLLTSLIAFLSSCQAWLSRVSGRSGTNEKNQSNLVIANENGRNNPPKNKFNMTMGLRKYKGVWLDIDSNYVVEHNLRKSLLEKMKGSVLGCLPIAEEACRELLDTVAQHLSRDFPRLFQKESREDTQRVKVVETGEVFDISRPMNGKAALEIAAKLAMEDLNILMKGPNDEHILYVAQILIHHGVLTRDSQASASCFPVGWAVEERLGWPLHMMHTPVPLWKEKLHSHVER